LDPKWGGDATQVVRIEFSVGIKLYQGKLHHKKVWLEVAYKCFFPKDVKVDKNWIKK